MHRRGEIWLANLNPPRGTEPGKTRPVLLIQAQALLDAEHPFTIVIPLTTQLVEHTEPLRVRVPRSGKLRRDSDLLIDQVRTVDARRLVSGPLLQLDDERMERVAVAIREVLELEDGQDAVIFPP